jgi:hypothetical protein
MNSMQYHIITCHRIFFDISKSLSSLKPHKPYIFMVSPKPPFRNLRSLCLLPVALLVIMCRVLISFTRFHLLTPLYNCT